MMPRLITIIILTLVFGCDSPQSIFSGRKSADSRDNEPVSAYNSADQISQLAEGWSLSAYDPASGTTEYYDRNGGLLARAKASAE